MAHAPTERRPVMIAAIYARKSNDDERTNEDGRSIDRQVELARAFALSRGGGAVTEVFSDDGISGAEFVNRPGFTRMVEAAKHRPRPVDAVILMALNRLGRDQVNVMNALTALRDAGIKVFPYQTGNEVKLETPTEILVASVEAFADAAYRHTIKVNTREALIRKAKLGHNCGQKTFGYAAAGTRAEGSPCPASAHKQCCHAEQVIHEGQAKIIRRVFELAAGGHGNLRIVTTLRAEGVQAPGSKWSKSVVRDLLENELYRGVLIFGRTRSVDKNGHAGRREGVPQDDWIRVQVPHLRIIDDELWAEVQRRKDATRRHYLRAPDGTLLGRPEAGLVARHLLNGLLRCPCGASMGYMAKGGRSRPKYYCNAYLSQRSCSNSRGIPAKDRRRAGEVLPGLDRVVQEKLRGMLTEEVLDGLWRDREAKIKVALDRLYVGDAAAEREIAVLEAEIARLVSAIAAGTASPDIATAIAERRSRVDALRARPTVPTFDPEERERHTRLMLKAHRNAFEAADHQNIVRDPAAGRQAIRALGVERI